MNAIKLTGTALAASVATALLLAVTGYGADRGRTVYLHVGDNAYADANDLHCTFGRNINDNQPFLFCRRWSKENNPRTINVTFWPKRLDVGRGVRTIFTVRRTRRGTRGYFTYAGS
jgi:hypothetical protein